MRLKFTIRDLVWAVTIVALWAAWRYDLQAQRRRQQETVSRLRYQLRHLDATKAEYEHHPTKEKLIPTDVPGLRDL